MDGTPISVASRIADELKLHTWQVESVVELSDEGNTVPFITRYRKERTGNLDEQKILAILKRVSALRQLRERAEAILRLIDAQGKLTPQLRKDIEQATSLKRLEDLYLPFRPKRKSRATTARQRGLEPLADLIRNNDPQAADLEQAAERFVDTGNDVPDAAAALAGASDILAERISENPDVRDAARKVASRTGRLEVSATKSAEQSGQAYRDYFDYSEAVGRIPPHRILAVNRGEKDGVLRVKFTWDLDAALEAAGRQLGVERHRHARFLAETAADALRRLIQPSLEREIRRELTERAENHALGVFSKNLRALLLQPPVRGQRVLAIDPGFRTGCKVAVLDERGAPLAGDVVYVTGSDEKKQASIERLAQLASEHGCRLIAIGNGTGCRETEELVSRLIASHVPEARYVIVNEAGASIYSTSTVAREEFPDLDATERGTISIGRRLLDPLSELVKIDPQHVGVGMYQHDLPAKRLREAVDEVVISCVNYVGVDLSTASASLLKYVSGLNQLIARRIVDWRWRHGGFRNRGQLLEVSGLGEATFTQAAGFLRVNGGDEPLDGTWIHPESYGVARKLLTRLGAPDNTAELPTEAVSGTLDRAGLAAELSVGEQTLEDILEALARPGRDPRGELPGPVFKQGILTLEDLHEGLELTGTVLNVVDFGAFVDFGLKDSGLVHISEMATHFVKNPHDLVAVGDAVTVWVRGVDRERRRVSLTMIPPGAEEQNQRPKAAKKKRKRDSQQAAARKPHNPASTPPNTEQRAGDVLLGGFDELKEHWRNRR